MSFEFRIAVPGHRAVCPGDILPDMPGLVRPQALADDQWPLGQVMLWLEGRSTRGVQVTRGASCMEIRIPACASEEDYSLALTLAEQIGASTGQDIEPEDGDAIAPEALRDTYSAAWTSRMVCSGPSTVVTIVQTRGRTVTIPGPVRHYHLGPRRLAELEAAGPPEDLGARVLDDLRAVQHLDLGDAVEVGVLQVGGEGSTFAVLGPDVRHLVPAVKRVALSDERSPVIIPVERLRELVPFTFVDEEAMWVGPIPGARWPELVARARAFEEPLGVPVRKPWWKFW